MTGPGPMVPRRPLRIAWLGGAPGDTGGAPGVVTELLDGLASLGHEIDCFFPGSGQHMSGRFSGRDNPTFVFGQAGWRWDRWYSRTRLTSFASGLLARSSGQLRLRREIVRRHRSRPYDLIYQNQTIESLGVPASMRRSVPLVVRPDSHQAGELRWQLAERRLAFRCQPRRTFFIVAAIMAFRALVQHVRIRRVDLLICISTVFRDHIVHDYGFPVEKTVVITNPVRLARFNPSRRPPGDQPVVLVPTRLSVRKGLEDVIAVAQLLAEREAGIRIRIVGGPSSWSDYSKLLDDLPAENSEYGGRIPPSGMPDELERSDIVLLASKYDPCPMSVLEGLAAGLPIVATSEVGSIEGVDRKVVAEVRVGDVEGMADAIVDMVERLRADPTGMRSLARAEAERRFAPGVVCAQISDALQALVAERLGAAPARYPARARKTSAARERRPAP